MGASVDDRKEERIQQLAERILQGTNDPSDLVPIPPDFTKDDFDRTLAYVAMERHNSKFCYTWFIPVRPCR